MKGKFNPSLLSSLLLNIALTATVATSTAYADYEYKPQTYGKMVVANRASGSISVINANSNALEQTITLPAGDNPAQPMYVVYNNGYVFVGDRGNNRVIVYDPSTYKVISTIAAGAGVFHMWADQYRGRLWVNNDIDNTVTVINIYTLSVEKTVSLPEDLTSKGFKPHDIFVDENSKFAYISMLDGKPGNDYVIKINGRNFKEVARQEVGGDPHLFLSPQNRKDLFVASQDAGTVSTLNRRNLSVSNTVEQPGAHGIYAVGDKLYVSNISAGGKNALNSFNARDLNLLDSDDAPVAVPHNIAATRDGLKIFITHSGPTQNTVSIYSTDRKTASSSYEGQVTVENNPFGIGFVPY